MTHDPMGKFNKQVVDANMQQMLDRQNETERKRMLKALREDMEAFNERKAKLDATAPDETSAGGDKKLADNQQHKPVEANAHISKKVYMFPEEYNALRRELEENYPTFFTSVNPHTGVSPAHAMVFDAPAFIGMCNGVLDLTVQFDTENVAGICKEFLNGFRKLRGVSEL